jgi:hypothetical protein
MTFAKEEEIEVRGFRVKYEGADAWTARGFGARENVPSSARLK